MDDFQVRELLVLVDRGGVKRFAVVANRQDDLLFGHAADQIDLRLFFVLVVVPDVLYDLLRQYAGIIRGFALNAVFAAEGNDAVRDPCRLFRFGTQACVKERTVFRLTFMQQDAAVFVLPDAVDDKADQEADRCREKVMVTEIAFCLVACR